MKPRASRVRLLPIVIVAVSGLLVLKATALMTHTDLLFAEAKPPKKIRTEEDLPRFARVLAKMRFVPPPADPEITGSVPAKKDGEKKEPDKKDATKGISGKDGGKVAEAKSKEEPVSEAQKQAMQPLPQSASASERALLERLQERRGSIDDRAREIEMRENLLKAAEKKVDGRIDELKEIEGRIDGGFKAQQAEAEKQMKSVVIMYETMKPKEAARVFDRLNLQVLVPIATTMKPARMAEILAVMSPEAAEKLTVALASRARTSLAGGAGDKARAGDVDGELPSLAKQR